MPQVLADFSKPVALQCKGTASQEEVLLRYAVVTIVIFLKTYQYEAMTPVYAAEGLCLCCLCCGGKIASF